MIMGVAGSGKTTVGSMLAARNHGVFFDADAFHPPSNVEKMAAGIPLNDIDRAPWLDRLKNEIIDSAMPGQLTVLACSALKKSYRERLGVGSPGIRLFHLESSQGDLLQRLQERSGHFMKAEMLASQIATLEVPDQSEGIVVATNRPVLEVVKSIEAFLAK